MKLFAIVAIAVTLVGCGMNRDVIEMAKAACHRENGEVSFNTTSDGVVLQVNCTIDGITYRVGENTGKMFDGRKVQ